MGGEPLINDEEPLGERDYILTTPRSYLGARFYIDGGASIYLGAHVYTWARHVNILARHVNILARHEINAIYEI